MTDAVIIAAMVLLLAYEAWALWKPLDNKQPITTVIRRWNRESHGLVALLFGVLAGHFFWCGP